MFGLKQVEVGLRLDKAGGKDVAKMSKDWIHTFGYGMVWHGMAWYGIVGLGAVHCNIVLVMLVTSCDACDAGEAEKAAWWDQAIAAGIRQRQGWKGDD